ncbi:hypothetical protein CAEBREN_32500, partial [Caenorhabditis brenneri]
QLFAKIITFVYQAKRDRREEPKDGLGGQ